MPATHADAPRHLAAYALCWDPEDRLLLVRMSAGPDRGRWTLPGGGVEWGEHPDRALVRELHEEAGLVGVAPGRVVAVYSHTYPRGGARPVGLHHVGLVYEVRSEDVALRSEQDGSTDRCAWFTATEARALPLTPSGEFGVRLAWPG
ncbi:MAG TPA: NUDIX domain-containing protein [Acidimicrobiales bacterium]|nr:NUDIX domain-containing protein [Acidimicrobiales bacterium]